MLDKACSEIELEFTLQILHRTKQMMLNMSYYSYLQELFRDPGKGETVARKWAKAQ
jgi:hypothetical protein